MPHDDNGALSPSAEAPYSVGHGRPPQHSRFQRGHSGNPRGRPKGSLNLATFFVEALNQKVTVTEQGKSRKISKAEAIATQAVNRAVKGDHRATKLILEVQARREANSAGRPGAGQGEQPPPPTSPSADTPEIPDFSKMPTKDLEILMEAAWIMDGKRERPPIPMPPEDPGDKPDDPDDKSE